MKKLLIVLLGAALIGCGKKTVSEEQADPGSTVTKTASAAKDPFLEDIDATRAGELVKLNNSPVLLDVRTPEEFAEGHIEGAINIDFKGENFKTELAKLDPEGTYLFHCRSGGRSTAAKPVFEELNFKHLYHLDGGMLGWEEAGLPVEK